MGCVVWGALCGYFVRSELCGRCIVCIGYLQSVGFRATAMTLTNTSSRSIDGMGFSWTAAFFPSCVTKAFIPLVDSGVVVSLCEFIGVKYSAIFYYSNMPEK